MKVSLQIHVRFSFWIFVYFSYSRNAFCSRYGDHYLSHSISLETGNNKHLTTPKNRTIDRPSNNFIFNVLHYGARGDGITNDAEAFIATWNISCKTKGGIMLVPSGFTFLLQRVNFDGIECQPNIVVQVDGKITAPSKKLNWAKNDLQWILFNGVSKGMTIKGEGVIDGFGDSWWNANHTKSAPHAVRIEKSSNITIRGITIENSPLMHIFIENCKYVIIHNFTVRSPAHSPNTDGIHISRVQHALIYNTTIACGDDCVSIQTGCSDVKIYDVKCGPGHGFSIGGLGPNLQEAHVSDIAVFNSSVQDAMTGVRIKTWPGGHGSVQNIVFWNIEMWNVGTPIVIDQFYCGGHDICSVTDSDNMNAVAISNVTYNGIMGTYSYKPLSLACSYFHPCTDLMVAAVHLLPTDKSAGADPHCFYAYGKPLTNNTPSLDYCLDPQQPHDPHLYCRRPGCTGVHAPPPDAPPSTSPSPHHPHIYCRRLGCNGEHAPPPAAPPLTSPSPVSPGPHHPHIYCRRSGCTREHAPPAPSPSPTMPTMVNPRLRHPHPYCRRPGCPRIQAPPPKEMSIAVPPVSPRLRHPVTPSPSLHVPPLTAPSTARRSPVRPRLRHPHPYCRGPGCPRPHAPSHDRY